MSVNLKNGKVYAIAAAVLAAIVIIGCMAVLWAYDPLKVNFYPRCWSKALTGYDCPGCGMLRASHAILHGDVAAAWHYNAALFFIAPIMVLLFVGQCRPQQSLLHRIGSHWLTGWAILGCLVLWAVARNIFWPL